MIEGCIVCMGILCGSCSTLLSTTSVCTQEVWWKVKITDSSVIHSSYHSSHAGAAAANCNSNSIGKVQLTKNVYFPFRDNGVDRACCQQIRRPVTKVLIITKMDWTRELDWPLLVLPKAGKFRAPLNKEIQRWGVVTNGHTWRCIIDLISTTCHAVIDGLTHDWGLWDFSYISVCSKASWRKLFEIKANLIET